jgi:hypothetical protein
MKSFPFDFGSLEVYQEGGFEAGHFQVVEALGGVFGGQAVYAFQFDQELVLDSDIGLGGAA